ncbi:MAG: FAD-dependent oxidoreductase [Candidatus Eremiobacteraeota bacterium]|nr:FAD-dependent oxidoreductase [Candidatus Eremiobacteraeota bacterium]
MNIAIIGSGISGMTAAWLLHRTHAVTLFEANDYIGGHTHTVDVEAEGKSYPVDTGFIVFNESTYPIFCRILKELEVQWQPTGMDFSVKSERDGLEYNAKALSTLFSQKKNLFDPSFYRMFLEALKFSREFDRILQEEEEHAIEEYLRERGYSLRFMEQLIIPLGASLWSSDPEQFRSFPVKNFVRFFKNHGFLGGKSSIRWLVIKKGSRTYADKMTAPFKDRIRLSTPVAHVTRSADGVQVITARGDHHLFDQVVMAVHSDQALQVLEEPTALEREILGAFPYQENRVYLHTDHTILPRDRNLWASWNYLIPAQKLGRAAVTYDMNILQSLGAPVEFCVTLNRLEALEREKILQEFLYAHPQYDPAAVKAQERHLEISGVDRIHYCGAYWGYGFHEDGARSAVNACSRLGVSLQ